MRFVHQHQQWPALTWRADELVGELTAVRHKQGRLLGRMESLGFFVCCEADRVVLTMWLGCPRPAGRSTALWS